MERPFRSMASGVSPFLRVEPLRTGRDVLETRTRSRCLIGDREAP
jgi:hypothetical protein